MDGNYGNFVAFFFLAHVLEITATRARTLLHGPRDRDVLCVSGYTRSVRIQFATTITRLHVFTKYLHDFGS
ncbi:hypothetical protein V1520DRAFT_340237 [Lipomyces starkeyi]